MIPRSAFLKPIWTLSFHFHYWNVPRCNTQGRFKISFHSKHNFIFHVATTSTTSLTFPPPPPPLKKKKRKEKLEAESKKKTIFRRANLTWSFLNYIVSIKFYNLFIVKLVATALKIIGSD